MSELSPNQIKFNCEQVFDEMEILHHISPLLKKFCQGNILDLGAGSGTMAAYLRDKGKIICVESSEKLMKKN